MPKVSIKEVAVGMVLATDVINRNGMPLLRRGCAISERHINVLKTWGISQVEIEGDGNETPIQELLAAHPEYVAEADAGAAEKFSHVDQTHPLFTELMQLWKQQYVLSRIKRS